jgi:hypothetical protein
MTKKKEPEKVEGHLIVGATPDGEVVLCVPKPGDIIFTPAEARSLAAMLLEKADQAEPIAPGRFN